jgi:acyl carrier protein
VTHLAQVSACKLELRKMLKARMNEPGEGSVQSGSPLDELVMSMIATACNLDREQITASAALDEVGLDSLITSALMARLEAAYDCEFSPDQVVQLLEARTVEEFCQRAAEVVAQA